MRAWWCTRCKKWVEQTLLGTCKECGSLVL